MENKIKVEIVKNYNEMSTLAAKIFADQIRENPKSILGLATGGTPEGMYKILRDNKNLNWKYIKTFNLDEYVNIPISHAISYHSYMNKMLFNHININKENINIPDNKGNIDLIGKEYDKKIEEMGGIDLQVLGIGQNAHIAFNEPGSSFAAGTREVELTPSTIKANSRFFDSPTDVPKKAISMGIGTILKSKKIILIASGKNKKQAIYDALKGPISVDCPASSLRGHNNVTFIIDEDAASLL